MKEKNRLYYYLPILFIFISSCSVSIHNYSNTIKKLDEKDKYGFFFHFYLKPTLLESKNSVFRYIEKFGNPYKFGIRYQQSMELKYKKLKITKFVIQNKNNEVLYDFLSNSKNELEFDFDKQLCEYDFDEQLNLSDVRINIFINISLEDSSLNCENRKYYYEYFKKKTRTRKLMFFIG